MGDRRLVYERLSRPHFGLNGTASLWLGSDHLIQVSNTFGWERYRRWFFRDIQAVIARRNSSRFIWNVVVGMGGLFIGLGATVLIITSATSGDRIPLLVIAAILGVIAAGFLAVALVNTLLGPTCTVFVVTPRGMEKLAGPGRLVVFERIVERVRPLAEQAQVAVPTSTALHPEDLGVAFDQRPRP